MMSFRHVCRLVLFSPLVAALALPACADGSSSDGSGDEPAAVEVPLAFARGPGRSCGAVEPSGPERLKDLGLMKLARPSHKAGTTNVEVVFHVITNGAQGTVTNAQIADQIAVLNDAYAPDFSFTLRETKRYNNRSWFTFKGENKLKKQTRVGGAGVLNVWTGDAGQYLGWATFPSNYAGSPGTDGVVIDYRAMPGGSLVYTSGGQTYAYNQGDTLTHEAGHWLGLYHTFQGGCAGSGDSVDDTPAEASPDYDCTLGRDTCPGGGLDPVTNYMDYSDDVCLDHFTNGQATRMNAQWATYRAR